MINIFNLRTLKSILIIYIILFLGEGLFSQDLNRINKNDSIFLDTIFCGDYKFISELISNAEFEKLKSNSKSKYYLSSSTSKITEGESVFANRINKDSILLKLKDGSLKWICNQKGGEYGFSYCLYFFMDYLYAIDNFLFAVKGYEWDNYYMVDANTGKLDTITLLQTFSIDSINKVALTTTFDGFAFMGGGFKYFLIEDGKLHELCELKEMDSYTEDYVWAITDCYWTRQNEFIYIQNFMNRNTSREKRWFMKMKIEKYQKN